MSKHDTTLKTPAQLEVEIAYYLRLIRRTTSADRKARAHIAIRQRERQLTEARRVAVGTLNERESDG